jgi:uncharacterized protein
MSYEMDSRPGLSFTAGFFILIALLGAGLLVGALVSGGIWVAMTHTSIFAMQKEMANPAHLQAIRMVQLVSTFFIFFLPAWITAYILNKRPFRFLGYNLDINWKQLGLAIAIMAVALPVVGALAEVNKWIPLPATWTKVFKDLEDSYTDQVKVLAHISGFGDYLYALVIMAIAPAAFEETFFRGGMQNLLHRSTKNMWLAILITSVVFSAIHFSWYGFLARMALGVVLGLLYAYSGSLWMSIVAHAFNNALVVTQLYILNLKGKPIDDAMDESYPVWAGVVATMALVALMAYYKKVSLETRREKMSTLDLAREEKWLA